MIATVVVLVVGAGGVVLGLSGHDSPTSKTPIVSSAATEAVPSVEPTATESAGAQPETTASSPSTAAQVSQPSANPTKLAKAVDGLTRFYAQSLGLDDEDAHCIATTVVGWQAGPNAVPDGASKPLTDALKACGLTMADVHTPAPTS